MARLVVLSEGLKGKAQELKVDLTTIGRVEDNTFQLTESSVSSHHCEVLVKGTDVVVRDLNSTNGTFINGEKITEATLKPGSILRLGQVELKLEVEGVPASNAAPAPSPAPASGAPAPSTPPPPKKAPEPTVIMQQGVKLSDLEQGPVSGFDTSDKAFSKKSNQVNRYFVIGGALIAAVIIGLIIYLAITI
jgi:pSer/pThr/pTyr-binding forkhead associated (FHA) protein